MKTKPSVIRSLMTKRPGKPPLAGEAQGAHGGSNGAGISAVPSPEAEWPDIEEFALSNEPAHGRAELWTRAGRMRREWTRYGALPDDLVELRAYLFLEQRRWNLFGGEPEGRARQYVTALVSAIAEAAEASEAEGRQADSEPTAVRAAPAAGEVA